LTLVVCLKGKDGMVLASDSRGTFGDPRATTAQNDNMKKVYAVSKYVSVLLAGSGELGSMVINEIHKKLEQEKKEGITPLMELIREILIRKYDEWFKGFQIIPVQGSVAPVRPTLVVIIGGYDIDNGGKPIVQRIYSLNCHNNFAPFLNRLYSPDSTVKNLLPLASYVITETASQDGKVGGPVQMMKILPDAGCMTLDSEEINKIVESNVNRSKNLKVSFFE